MKFTARKMIEAGVRVSDSRIFEQDRIWSKYSHDKVDIGEELAKVIRTLHKAFPLSKPLRALSIGSSNEPQFRILETAFRGGLYLLDIEESPLECVKERIKRQSTKHVRTIKGDYNNFFSNKREAEAFIKNKLENKKLNLITLHHSLYYCKECGWLDIYKNLYGRLLSSPGAMHAVLMASKSADINTTTWLYNHFAGKYFGVRNDQDLYDFSAKLKKNALFNNARILIKTNSVDFFVPDFSRFMSVVWMILLYPMVHKYTREQREEITEYVFKNFWTKKRPLVQNQDHLVIYKGIGFKGLI